LTQQQAASADFLSLVEKTAIAPAPVRAIRSFIANPIGSVIGRASGNTPTLCGENIKRQVKIGQDSLRMANAPPAFAERRTRNIKIS